MLQRRCALPLALSAAAILIVGSATTGHAASTSPTVSPTFVTPGSTSSITVTYTLTSSEPGAWDTGAAFELTGFTPAVSGGGTVTFAPSTITCTFAGGKAVTWSNSVLASHIAADIDPQCYAYSQSGFLRILLFGASPLVLSAPQAIAVNVGSGVLTATAAEGQYDVMALLMDVAGNVLDSGTTQISVSSSAPAPEPEPEPEPEPTVEAVAPRPAAHQGLPMPNSGSCADVQDADYSWGTGLSGGWQKSWQPWVRAEGSAESVGGWACIRTLQNTGGETWVIAN